MTEEGGKPLTAGLMRSNPFPTEGCRYGDKTCIVDPAVPCDSASACYRITCSMCSVEHDMTEPEVTARRPDRYNGDRDRKNYTGMTGQTLHARQREHMNDVEKMNTNNALVKHIMKDHNESNEVPRFSMKIITKHRTNLDRCIMEGLLIEKVEERNRINCKTEWSKTRGLVRLSAGRT